MSERALTISQAAARLGMHPATIRRRILSGEVPAELWAGRYWLNEADADQIKLKKAPNPVVNVALVRGDAS